MHCAFHESRLVITFGPSWSVLRFDQSVFFKTLTGQGLRGVDFVGIHGNHLYLIEVKNYTRAKNQAAPSPPEALAFREMLVEKFEDSQRIIRIIHATFRRYMVFRWWQWVASHINFLFLWAPEPWVFWTRCYRLSNRGDAAFTLLLIDPDERIHLEHLPEEWQILHGPGVFAELPDVIIQSE